jgi:hypothetical protein
MEEVIDHVMHTYGMMVNLTEADEQNARERVTAFLKSKSDNNSKLTVEGVKFLRGDRAHRARRA